MSVKCYHLALAGIQAAYKLGSPSSNPVVQLQAYRFMAAAAGQGDVPSRDRSGGRPREADSSDAAQRSDTKKARTASSREQPYRNRPDASKADDAKGGDTGFTRDQKHRNRADVRQSDGSREAGVGSTRGQQYRNRTDARQLDRRRSDTGEFEKPTALQELEDEVLDLRVFIKDAFMQ
jgi:hypothetical protein